MVASIVLLSCFLQAVDVRTGSLYEVNRHRSLHPINTLTDELKYHLDAFDIKNARIRTHKAFSLG